VASEFWRFTAFQAVATVVQIVLLRLDVVLVSSLRSAEEAGIYAAASRYLTFGVMISTSPGASRRVRPNMWDIRIGIGPCSSQQTGRWTGRHRPNKRSNA